MNLEGPERVTLGDEAQFPVTLAGGKGSTDITVNYTAGGTPNSVTITGGQTSGMITVDTSGSTASSVSVTLTSLGATPGAVDLGTRNQERADRTYGYVDGVGGSNYGADTVRERYCCGVYGEPVGRDVTQRKCDGEFRDRERHRDDGGLHVDAGDRLTLSSDAVPKKR